MNLLLKKTKPPNPKTKSTLAANTAPSPSKKRHHSRRSSLRNSLTCILPSHISPRKTTLTIASRPLTVIRTISENPSSTVLEVSDQSSKHFSRYAVKSIPLQKNTTNNSEFFEIEQRARIEINALRQVRHEHVLTLLESEWGDENPNGEKNEAKNGRFNLYCYILSPLYDTNLAIYISQHGALQSQNDIRNIFTGICNGLNAINKAGFRHNDLQPENILLQLHDNGSSSPFPVIADFGAVGPIRVEVNSKWEAQRQMKFHLKHTSASYRAPELNRIVPKMVLTETTDAFSLGCVLFYVLFGKCAFGVNSSPKCIVPSNHSVNKFSLNLCLGLMLSDPMMRLTVKGAIEALLSETLKEQILLAIWVEYRKVEGVEKVKVSDVADEVASLNKIVSSRVSTMKGSGMMESVDEHHFEEEYIPIEEEGFTTEDDDSSSVEINLIKSKNSDEKSEADSSDETSTSCITWMEFQDGTAIQERSFDHEVEEEEEEVEVEKVVVVEEVVMEEVEKVEEAGEVVVEEVVVKEVVVEEVVEEVEKVEEEQRTNIKSHPQPDNNKTHPQPNNDESHPQPYNDSSIIKSGPLRQKRRTSYSYKQKTVWKTVYLYLTHSAELRLKKSNHPKSKTLFRECLSHSEFVNVSLLGKHVGGEGYVMVISHSDPKKSGQERGLRFMAKDEAEAKDWADCIVGTWKKVREMYLRDIDAMGFIERRRWEEDTVFC